MTPIAIRDRNKRDIKQFWWSRALNIDEYYQTAHWIRTSKWFRITHPKCKYCWRRSEHAHHKRYWRYVISWNLRIIKVPVFYHERFWMLEAVCVEHHKWLHS